MFNDVVDNYRSIEHFPCCTRGFVQYGLEEDYRM